MSHIVATLLPGLIGVNGGFNALTVGIAAHEAVHVEQWKTEADFNWWNYLFNIHGFKDRMEAAAGAVYDPNVNRSKPFTVVVW